jgi:hypothetical protein
MLFFLQLLTANLDRSIVITLTSGLARLAGLHQNIVAEHPVTFVAHLVLSTVFR